MEKLFSLFGYVGGFKHCRYLLLFLCSHAIAQNSVEKVKFSRLDPSLGLSNIRFTTIVQDSKGTEDGLNRFDGYEFIYRNIIGDTTSLQKNTVKRIYEDKYHNLWISTNNGGLHVYDSEHDNFIRQKIIFLDVIYTTWPKMVMIFGLPV